LATAGELLQKGLAGKLALTDDAGRIIVENNSRQSAEFLRNLAENVYLPPRRPAIH
jgi:hypothetical protein